MQRVVDLSTATAILILLIASVRAGSGRKFPTASELPERVDLPDPLVMLDGKRIATKEEWFDKRRPELQALFQHYMYGYCPAPRKVESFTKYENKTFLGGKATLKDIT